MAQSLADAFNYFGNVKGFLVESGQQARAVRQAAVPPPAPPATRATFIDLARQYYPLVVAAGVPSGARASAIADILAARDLGFL